MVKRKTGKKGKEKKKAPMRPRKSHLEWEIACENAILADLRRQVADSQDKFQLAEDEAKNKRNDIDDVMGFAQHEIKEEEEEIRSLEDEIEIIQELKGKQNEYYMKIIEDATEKANRIVKELIDEVYYEKTTLQIMKVANREYNRYLEALSDFEEEKTRLQKELDLEMYEEDQLTRIDVRRNKIKMINHINNLEKLLIKKPTESFSAIKSKMEKDAKQLMEKVVKLFKPYRNCIKSNESASKLITNVRISHEIDIDELNGRNRKLQHIDKRVSVLTELMFDEETEDEEEHSSEITIEADNHEIQAIAYEEPCRKTIISIFPSREQALINYLKKVRDLILAAINVEERSWSTGWSISIDDDELEEQVEAIYKKREDIIEQIFNMLDDEQIQFDESSEMLQDKTLGILPHEKEKKKDTKIKVEHARLMRPQFMANWRQPNAVYLRQIKKQANLLIGNEFRKE